VSAPADSSSPGAGLRSRPGREVTALATLLWVAVAIAIVLTPDADAALRPAGIWALIVVASLFAVFEAVIFEVEFRREAITFTFSEIPLALALAFLTPAEAFAARLPLAVVMLVLVRRNHGVKLYFNLAIYSFDIAVSILVTRLLLRWWQGQDERLVLAVAVTMAASSIVTSVMISLAISRYEGGARERITTEIVGSWWLYPVTSVLAGMTLALALLSPWLIPLALLPIGGIWFILRAFGQRQQELRDLGALHGFAGLIGGSLDPDEISEVATVEVERLMRASGAALVRFGPTGVNVHRSGDSPFPLPANAEDPAWREVLASATPSVLTLTRLRELGIDPLGARRSLLVAPLVDGDEPYGLVVVYQRDKLGAAFDHHDIARMQNITEQLSVGLRRALLHERLEHEARHDALTDLPARKLFERFVADVIAARPPGVWAVMMLDLDRFKEVNDTLGHHAGDALLIEFSNRITSLLGEQDHLARLAGDEFAILANRPDGDLVVALAQACAHEAGRPVNLDGLEIVVTVSVGVAEVLESDADALQPMRRADIAMYNAKWQRSGVELYRDEIDRRTPARLSMLGDLRAAIENDELDVVYQPKLDLVSGAVVGVEALVRWVHEARGVVAPTEFVRVAEDTGLIKDLTNLVLARGIATLRHFHDQGLVIGLAVNLSTHDLFDVQLPDRVRAYLASSGVDPDSLTLEITESSLLIDAPRTRATIDDLHAVGLRLAIDDYGTGYSSLSYLRRLPVHELKIDQSFVTGMLTDPQDEVIVRSTVDLGHNLGLQVVAEGVENRAVLDRLREFGCDVAQGYAISAPLSREELPAFVRHVSAHTGPPMAWVGASA
jgi:diguanylate cyclase (GGDEF)-like protein